MVTVELADADEDVGKDDGQTANAQSSSQPPPESRTATFLKAVACQRRQDPEAQRRATLQRYRDLIAFGRKVTGKTKDYYDKLTWWSDVETRRGSRIFVIAPRGPRGQTDYWIYIWELFAYACCKMHDHVVVGDKPFAVVWLQFSDHRMWSCSLMSFKNSLHPKYRSNLEAVHVVHPSWGVRLLRLALWPIASDEFWQYFHSHERIEFMAEFINMKIFRLPKDVYEYDKELDRQAAEMNRQAQGHFGGGGMFGGAMPQQTPEEKEKQHEEMEKLKQLLMHKGYGGKND